MYIFAFRNNWKMIVWNFLAVFFESLWRVHLSVRFASVIKCSLEQDVTSKRALIHICLLYTCEYIEINPINYF